MSTQFHEQRLRHNSPVSDDLIRWLDAFLIDRQSLNVTSGTMRFYHDKIKLLVDYAKSREIACVSDFTPTNIREYLIALSANHNPLWLPRVPRFFWAGKGACPYGRVRSLRGFTCRLGMPSPYRLHHDYPT